ncbi:MAG TPA: HD domain-containing protein, partial [Candidatus Ozemobacteraceae bacterium]|nr:HD domain-containing protein [Candidatus Ozemobacteraceae bacterium]
EIWLVGGAVRDLVLGATEIADCDLAVSVPFTAQANTYARNKKSGFVMLDEDHEVARIVRSIEGRSFTVDIARFRAEGIDGDLQGRDFTINAMAVRVTWPLLDPVLPLYDPLGGREALVEKRLKMCAPTAFQDDPLRVMRAFRFGAGLGMRFDEELTEAIRRDAPLLEGVSGERIRDELFKMLATSESAAWIETMSKLGVLARILPELEEARGVSQNGWHHLDVFDHTIEALRRFEALIDRNDAPVEGWKKFQAYLDEPISGNRTFRQVFKFACLLHDVGKPACRREREEDGRIVFHGHEMEGVRLCKTVAERFRLSTAELNFLMNVVKNHMRPGVILQEGLSDRRLFRYYTETGRDGVGIALMSLADRLAAQGPESQDDMAVFEKGIESIMSDFYRQMEYAKQAPLINGTDLMTHFRLQPGPKFREILDAVREAQHLGQVRDRNAALLFAGRLLSGRPSEEE